jgi:hypothetical protein
MVSRPERPGPPCNVPVWDRSWDPLLADPDAGHSKRATIAAPNDIEFVAQHGGGEAADLPVPRAAVVGWILMSQEQEDVEHLMCQGVVDVAGSFGEKRGGKGDPWPVLEGRAGQPEAVAVGAQADDDRHLEGELRVEPGPEVTVGLVGVFAGSPPECCASVCQGGTHVVSITTVTTDCLPQ